MKSPSILNPEDSISFALKYPMAQAPAPYCMSNILAQGETARFRYHCTREIGHTGPHVAHVSIGLAVGAWEED